MKPIWRLVALVAAVLCWVPAQAITGPTPEFKKLADGVYAYIGKQNDANAMVIVTPEGVVLVDTGNNNSDSRALLSDIRSITQQPVRYVVITQNHGDHVGGTPLFAPPAHVILQERVAKAWAAMKPYQVASWRKRFSERADALKSASPLDTVVTFGSGMSLHLGGRTIELLYVDDVYNPGDVAVWLPSDGILHASFVGYKDRHPDIRPDYSHGTTTGMLKQLDAYVALKPKIVVPAHGPIGDAHDLERVKDYLLLARQKVRTMMDRKMPLPAIEQAFDMKEFAGWDRTEHLTWTADTIYRELKGQGPLVVRTRETRFNGVVSRTVQDGRFVTVTQADGTALQLRVTADTDIEGLADRTFISAGMKLAGSYEIPEGMSAALGYDALEITAGR